MIKTQNVPGAVNHLNIYELEFVDEYVEIKSILKEGKKLATLSDSPLWQFLSCFHFSNFK